MYYFTVGKEKIISKVGKMLLLIVAEFLELSLSPYRNLEVYVGFREKLTLGV